MTAPSDEELRLLEEFRLKVADALENDEQRSNPYLLRWIRARESNLEKAEGILRTHLKWREENEVDKMLGQKRDEYFESNFPYFLRGRTKEGHPILEIPFGLWDFRKVSQQENGEQRFANHTTKMFEETLEAIRAASKAIPTDTWPITQVLIICDLSGFSYSQLFNLKAIHNLLSTASKYEAHYPEILFQNISVNCPSFISTLLKIVRPFLAPKTMTKIQTFGTERTIWATKILDLADPDQLGVQFGGICDRDAEMNDKNIM